MNTKQLLKRLEDVKAEVAERKGRLEQIKIDIKKKYGVTTLIAVQESIEREETNLAQIEKNLKALVKAFNKKYNQDLEI